VLFLLRQIAERCVIYLRRHPDSPGKGRRLMGPARQVAELQRIVEENLRLQGEQR
jgi:hypothetical protein